MSTITYSKSRRYKYRLESDYSIRTDLRPSAVRRVGDNWVLLFPSGNLKIRRGYAWDGPSGPTIDTKNWMRASLVHDALYQLLREGLLAGVPRVTGEGMSEHEAHRLYADDLMLAMLREDGMSRARAMMSYRGVRWFGKSAARKLPPAPFLTAP